jgi:hypothetical protein
VGGARRTGATYVRDTGVAVDKWGATTWSSADSGWVQEGEAARCDADTWARQHSARRCEFRWDSK